jgi:CxxC-x17-CxxC domain-containing protein
MDDMSGNYEDKVINCQDCNQEFVFTAGEQAFYDQKGFSAPPKRCKTCRDRRKTAPDGGGGGGGGGARAPRGTSRIEVEERPARLFRPREGERSTGGGDRGGGAGGGNKMRVSVKCSDCGDETTVPFQPAEGRPVYCRDCYQKRRG